MILMLLGCRELREPRMMCRIKTGKNKMGQVAVDTSLTWILWIIIAAVAGYGFVKLIMRFSG